MRGFAAALALATITTSLAAQARSDFAELYRQAVAHIARQEWKPAEDKLLAALKSGPNPGRGAIRRSIFDRDDYFPTFYLGVVYLNTNRPTDAQAQFQLARKQNIDLRAREFQGLPAYEARAKELADAEATKRAASDPKEQFKTLIEQAQRFLAEARYEDAEAAAKQARALNVDNDAVAAILQNATRSRAAARVQEVLNGTPSLSELRRLLTEYGDSGVSLDEVRRRIAVVEATDRRDAAERAAMIAFYSGNYSQAMTALTEAEKALALTARGQFYRALTLASQATRGKVVNEALLRDARNAWKLANARPQEFKADLAYVSPQLLRLVGGT